MIMLFEGSILKQNKKTELKEEKKKACRRTVE